MFGVTFVIRRAGRKIADQVGQQALFAGDGIELFLGRWRTTLGCAA